MGRRGPQPKPDAIKELTGSSAPKLEDKGWDVLAGTPKPPDYLPARVKTRFRSLAKALSQIPGLTKTIDATMLGELCLAIDTVARMTKRIEKEGDTCESESGALYQHPAVGIRNRASERIVQLSQHFGLSPTARGRITLAPPDEELDPISLFINAQSKLA